MFTSYNKNKSPAEKGFIFVAGGTAHRTKIRHRFMLTEEISCSYAQSHFPEPALQLDITADSMVLCIVPIPAKPTTLNTETSKYGRDNFGYRQQKNFQRS